ncbi:MAG: GldG family protein [Spirochaetaceae bacterium]|jgi:ABC-type uncharacterized transport system involved in gliding motility auxiliary subunit|nr:GldG family protein [Spirochaetaceae bacterium]
MTKKQQSAVTILSILIMLLLLLVSRRIWFRGDLTANNAYTLSPVSRNLYNEIDEEIRITYFLSGKLLSVDPAPSEITDLLREYEARSRGKIRVVVRDPGGDIQEVERYGLVPQQFQDVKQDEASFSMVYSGIVIEYLDKSEVLTWVFSLDTLEYDITSRIRSLVRGKRRELGVIACEPQKDWNEYYGYFNQALLESGYSVLPLSPGEEIPDTLPVLFVFGGVEELDEYSLYRIDRYIQLGGRVLFAVESVDMDFFSTWEARLKKDEGLLSMISYYGATVGQSLVLDRAALPVPYQDPVSRQILQIPYAPWVAVLEHQGNKDHVLTSKFGGLDLFWASPLTLTLPDPGTTGELTGEALFTSTPRAWLMTKDFTLRPEQHDLFDAEADISEGEKILALTLEGRFPSWFADVEKPRRQTGETEDEPWTALPEELPDMPVETKESRIVVVGDADIGGALVTYTQRQQRLNFDFLLQVADWLGNDDDIVGIRNRHSGSGRLDRITDELKREGTMLFSRLLNVFILPLCIIITGAYRIFKRKNKKEQSHAL